MNNPTYSNYPNTNMPPNMQPNMQSNYPPSTVSVPGQQGHTLAGQTGYTNVAFTGGNNWTTGA